MSALALIRNQQAFDQGHLDFSHLYPFQFTDVDAMRERNSRVLMVEFKDPSRLAYKSPLSRGQWLALTHLCENSEKVTAFVVFGTDGGANVEAWMPLWPGPRRGKLFALDSAGLRELVAHWDDAAVAGTPGRWCPPNRYFRQPLAMGTLEG